MPVFGRPYEKVLDTALRESVKAVTQTPSQKMVEAQQPGHHADHRPAAVWRRILTDRNGRSHTLLGRRWCS